jgi:hypothetical protein
MDTEGEASAVSCTARWRQGEWRVTIASPGGGSWEYDVIAAGDRPSRGWLIGTPWAIYPGAEWQEQPGGEGQLPVWTVQVFPEQPEVALRLTNDRDVSSST